MRDEARPLVSIVIPVLEEAGRIDACLRQLLALSYPLDMVEILVCDGMSRDGTRSIVEEFARRCSSQGRPSVRLVDNPSEQRSAALNEGIGASSGSLIARVDAGTRIPPDYLDRCVATMEATGADNVGGRVTPIGSGPTQEAIGLAVSHWFGVGNATFRVGNRSGPVESVYPGVFRKEVFERVGLFDAEAAVISEDSDINYRIIKAGGVVYLDASIRVYQESRESLRSLWRLYFRYGGARAGFYLKHKTLTSLRQLAPIVLVLALGLLLTLSSALWPARWALIALAVSYLAVTIAVSLGIAFGRRNQRLLPKLVAAFPTLHLSYGLGFLRRMIQRPKAGTYWRN